MSDLFRLDGKVALVTGASRGLGAGIARALAVAGADVIVHANVNELQVWIDSDSMVTSGITKNTPSQRMAGAPSRYGLTVLPRRPCRRGGATCRSARTCCSTDPARRPS